LSTTTRTSSNSLKVFFEAEGYQVRAYHDGTAAFAGLSENPPDIAILDIKMPQMDGMELLRQLRQTSDLPVIFLTSKDDEIDEVVGFNDRRRRLHPEALLTSVCWSSASRRCCAASRGVVPGGPTDGRQEADRSRPA